MKATVQVPRATTTTASVRPAVKNAARAALEQEARAVAEKCAVFSFGTIRIGPRGDAPQIQCDTGYPLDGGSRLARGKARFFEFIRSADKYGLPVKLLRRIGREASVVVDDASFYRPATSTLHLEASDLTDAIDLDPAGPFGAASAMRTLYEESTHAYLDLAKGEKPISEFIKAGKTHYEGAKTTTGKTTSSASRVFQEAAGTYVGHRVATFWLTYQMLAHYVAAGKLTQKRLDDLKRDYEKGMAERQFGYSDEGGFLGFGTHQEETTRPISTEMKSFMDSELLEGKTPDSFDAVPAFSALLATTAVAPPETGKSAPVQKLSLAGACETEDIAVELRGGVKLEPSIGSLFERRIGHDFSTVRIHTDEVAQGAATRIGAAAFTSGEHIFFAPGRYDARSSPGLRLLAHELTHVVQQRTRRIPAGPGAKGAAPPLHE